MRLDGRIGPPMEDPMTRTSLKTTAFAALATAAALAPLLAGTAAEAGGRGKDYLVQEYFFNEPMNGKQGFEGAFYCSYIKQPVEVPLPNGGTKKVWKLTQVCQ
jgi:hypothetical protein